MHAVCVGKEQNQGYFRRALLQRAHDFIGEEWISSDNEIGPHIIQQRIDLTAHQVCEHTVCQLRSTGHIEELELRCPQPERITAHKPVVQVEEARLRIDDGNGWSFCILRIFVVLSRSGLRIIFDQVT